MIQGDASSFELPFLRPVRIVEFYPKAYDCHDTLHSDCLNRLIGKRKDLVRIFDTSGNSALNIQLFTTRPLYESFAMSFEIISLYSIPQKTKPHP
jgi:hypothetical protein